MYINYMMVAAVDLFPGYNPGYTPSYMLVLLWLYILVKLPNLLAK